MSQFYQHRYGGLYEVLSTSKHTETGEDLVIYEHIYPFESSIWARPASMWTPDRFRPITEDELRLLLTKDRLQFQAEIQAAKAKK